MLLDEKFFLNARVFPAGFCGQLYGDADFLEAVTEGHFLCKEKSSGEVEVLRAIVDL